MYKKMYIINVQNKCVINGHLFCIIIMYITFVHLWCTFIMFIIDTLCLCTCYEFVLSAVVTTRPTMCIECTFQVANRTFMKITSVIFKNVRFAT